MINYKNTKPKKNVRINKNNFGNVIRNATQATQGLKRLKLTPSILEELWDFARMHPEQAKQEIRPLLHNPYNWDSVLDYNRGMRVGYGTPDVPHFKPSFNTEKGSFYQGLYLTDNPSRTGYKRFKFNGDTYEPLEITSFIPEYDIARQWGLSDKDEITYNNDIRRISQEYNPYYENPDVPADSYYTFLHAGRNGTSPKTAGFRNTYDVEDFNNTDFQGIQAGWRDGKTNLIIPKQNRFGKPAVTMPVTKYPVIGGHVVESTFNTSRGNGRGHHFGHQVSDFLNPIKPTITKNKLKKKRIKKSITPVIKDGINHILGGYNTLRGSTVLKQEKFTSNTKTNRNKYGC
jgi:hypothetical protein